MTNRAAAFFGCRPVRCFFKLCAPSLAHVQAREAGELDVVLIERAEAVEITGLPGLGLAAEMQYRRVVEYPVEAALAAAAEEVGVEIPRVVVLHRVVQLQRPLAVQGVQDVLVGQYQLAGVALHVGEYLPRHDLAPGGVKVDEQHAGVEVFALRPRPT